MIPFQKKLFLNCLEFLLYSPFNAIKIITALASILHCQSIEFDGVKINSIVRDYFFNNQTLRMVNEFKDVYLAVGINISFFLKTCVERNYALPLILKCEFSKIEGIKYYEIDKKLNFHYSKEQEIYFESNLFFLYFLFNFIVI